MEKAKMVGGLALSTTAAFVCIPLMTRMLNATELALATIILLAHALFGLLDTFRPIVVRRAVQNPRFATPGNLLLPSAGYAALLVPITLLLWAAFFSSYGIVYYLSFASSLLLFLLYVPLWGLVESQSGVGSAYMVRSASTASLYLLFALAGIMSAGSLILLALPAVHIASAAIFAWLARNYLVAGVAAIDRSYLLEAGHVAGQNATKVVTDFADRLAVSLVSVPGVIAAYNLIYEITSKSNVFAQLSSSYYYPIACRDRSAIGKLLSLGMLISSGISMGAVLFYLFGEPIYLLYFGENMRTFFPVFCSLLAVASVYSMSFFGQAGLRSLGMDRELSLSFLTSAVAGAALIAFFLVDRQLYEVVFGALAFRSSAVLMTRRLRQHHRWSYPFSIVIFVGTGCFVYFVLIGTSR